ncbi:MAG: DUF1638 domain-containing protein [Planctomycetia bacterium]|nr:DUF1638 domain-containing protein [Planctomycetia bacterium]
MRFKLISCEIFYRECAYLVAQSPHQVDMEFLPSSLHNKKESEMRQKITERIRACEEMKEMDKKVPYDAILLGYALCNRAIIGLKTQSTTMVVPRADNCVEIFFGNSQKYSEYFHTHPGTYYKTTGWIERGENVRQFFSAPVTHQNLLRENYECHKENSEEKCSENGSYFVQDEIFSDKKEKNNRHYTQLTFIKMGLGAEQIFENFSRDEAKNNGWYYDCVSGNLSLLRDLINGNWDDERFLIVPPEDEI